MTPVLGKEKVESEKQKRALQVSDRFSTSNEAHLGALGSIGLSQYESKCFLASLELGPSTINQIGITAGVPRTKVYGAVKKLVERGLVEQSEDDPKIYVARSPKDFLIPLLEKESKRIKESLDALTELEVIHQSMAFVKRAESLHSKVSRYSPRSAVTHKLKELIGESTKRVVVLTTANGLIRLSKMADLLFERSKEGLELEIHSATIDEPIFSTAVLSLNEIESCSISFLQQPAPIQVAVIDSEHLVMTELKPDDLKDQGMDVAFFIQNSELAEMMESLIRFISPQSPQYEKAKPVLN